MTHTSHNPPVDPALNALLGRTLGSGGLSADRKRVHHERLGLTSAATSSTEPSASTFVSTDDPGAGRVITSAPYGGSLRARMELVTVLAVVAVVLTGVVIYQTVLSDDGNEGATIAGTEMIEDYTVYRTTRSDNNSTALLPIDSATLEERSDLSGLEIDASSVLAISSDGSTLAIIEYSRRTFPGDDNLPADEVTIVVRDGFSGGERIRFHPPEHVQRPLLNQDGSRLVVQSRLVPDGAESARWHVFDTRDGTLITTIERERQASMSEAFSSADGATLYLANPRVPSTTDQPEPLHIIAYDVASGDEADRIELTDIPAGAWNRNPDAGSLVTDVLVPAVTLSPDGQRFAIVHADVQAVTLVDAESLTVEQTIQLSGQDQESAPWFERSPREPGGGARDHTDVFTWFSPDGRYLYITGSVIATNPGTGPSTHHFGLTLVDLEQGATIARAYGGEPVSAVTVSPDGKSIYVSVPDPADSQVMVLQRLDAHTLDVLAERSFDELHQIIIDPAPPDREDDVAIIEPTPTATATGPTTTPRPRGMSTPTPEPTPYAMEFHRAPDGPTMVFVSEVKEGIDRLGRVTVIDLASGDELFMVDTMLGVDATVSPDGLTLFVGSAQELTAFDLTTGEEIWSTDTELRLFYMPGFEQPSTLLASPDGSRLFVYSRAFLEEGRYENQFEVPYWAQVINTATGEIVADSEKIEGCGAARMSIAPDESMLYLRCLTIARWIAFDMETLEIVDAAYLPGIGERPNQSPFLPEAGSVTSQDGQTTYIVTNQYSENSLGVGVLDAGQPSAEAVDLGAGGEGGTVAIGSVALLENDTRLMLGVRTETEMIGSNYTGDIDQFRVFDTTTWEETARIELETPLHTVVIAVDQSVGAVYGARREVDEDPLIGGTTIYYIDTSGVVEQEFEREGESVLRMFVIP